MRGRFLVAAPLAGAAAAVQAAPRPVYVRRTAKLKDPALRGECRPELQAAPRIADYRLQVRGLPDVERLQDAFGKPARYQDAPARTQRSRQAENEGVTVPAGARIELHSCRGSTWHFEPAAPPQK